MPRVTHLSHVGLVIAILDRRGQLWLALAQLASGKPLEGDAFLAPALNLRFRNAGLKFDTAATAVAVIEAGVLAEFLGNYWPKFGAEAEQPIEGIRGSVTIGGWDDAGTGPGRLAAKLAALDDGDAQ